MNTEPIIGAIALAGLVGARRCSTEPEDLPPPPPIPDFTLDQVEAARFLTQATFGPTVGEIDALVELGELHEWIDQQVDGPMSLTLPYVRANSNGSLGSTRHHIWWDNAVNAPDQLRQRVAFALSELFVVSDRDYELSNSQYAVSAYYDMLGEEAFGNFRVLLDRVTLHPVMGIYLSMLRNERADPSRNIRPDENFAREVLQLFTIGLWELDETGQRRTDVIGDPIPTYDQTIVEEFAKVFTGWNFAGTDTWSSNDLTSYDKEPPMEALEEYHDTSEKRLLNGLVVPAGGSARRDLTLALNNIFAHPNVGPFVSTALIRFLVTSNPSPEYIGRVAAKFADNGVGIRGDMRATVTAILVDPEARNGHRSNPERFGKVKEPILRLTALWRAFDVRPGPDAGGVLHPPGAWIEAAGARLGQAPLQSPSVFNFFEPAHPLEPDGELAAPESQILSEINVASLNNTLFSQVFDHNTADPGSASRAHINIDREIALAGDPSALVDHLNTLLAMRALPDSMVADVVAHVSSLPDDDAGRIDRVTNAIFCIVGSPFHMVQK